MISCESTTKSWMNSYCLVENILTKQSSNSTERHMGVSNLSTEEEA